MLETAPAVENTAEGGRAFKRYDQESRPLRDSRCICRIWIASEIEIRQITDTTHIIWINEFSTNIDPGLAGIGIVNRHGIGLEAISHPIIAHGGFGGMGDA